MAKQKKKQVHMIGLLKDAALARIDDQPSREKLPTLMEVMLPVFDGSTLIRQGGKISIVPEGAHWRITLDCPTEVLTCRFVTNQLWQALTDAEEMLSKGIAVWSPGWSRNKKKLPTIDDLIQ